MKRGPAATVAGSAVGGWAAGFLLSVVDFLLATSRLPVRPELQDRAVMALYSLLSLPFAGLLLGATYGLLAGVLGRRSRVRVPEGAFLFVSGLLAAVYGAAYFVFRIGNPEAQDFKVRDQPVRSFVAVSILAALFSLLWALVRWMRLSARRTPPAVLYGLLAVWLGAIGAALLAARPPETPPAASSRHESLVLFISIDTLRADAVGIYGNPAARTPNIDALARQGAVFLHAQAAAPWTLPSHASMLTGLTMPQHGANLSTLRLSDAVPRVTEGFRDHGWQTAGFVSAIFVNSVFGFRRGFAVFDDATFAPWHQLAIPSLLRKLGRFLPFFDQPAERRAGEIMRRALPFLDRPGSKFLFIHLFDPHTDYDPPPGFRPIPSTEIRPPFDGRVGPLSAVNLGELPPPSPPETAVLRALYDGEASYADREIGRLLDEIRRRGLEERTSILLTSDHGEAFGEHGRFLHRSLHQEVLHVPFIVWAPGRIPPGLRISEVVRGIDVAPTLADLGGIRWKPSVGDSRSVLPLVMGADGSPRPARSDYEKGLDRREDWAVGSSLLVWPWKLYAPSGRTPQLFNLEGDPGETNDRANEQTEMTASLKAALESGDAPGEAGPPRVLDPETVRRLRALGYLR